MKQSIFKPFTVINLVIFMFLIGCGSFSANNSSLEQAEETVDANNLDIPTGNTPLSKDHEILNEYLTEFNRLEPERIENLASDIRSFEILVERGNNQFRSLLLKMHARTNRRDLEGTTITACDNLIIKTNINLTIQDSISLGRHSNYEFNIHCTDSGCDEMIASIRRIDPEGLVLIGLKSTPFVSGGNSYNRQYKSRSVDIEKYFTVAVTPKEYEDRVCSIEEDEDDNSNEDENESKDGDSNEETITPFDPVEPPDSHHPEQPGNSDIEDGTIIDPTGGGDGEEEEDSSETTYPEEDSYDFDDWTDLF